MALLSKDGAEFLLRWLHFLSGITWIGLLYYFNFVQGPFFAEADAATKSAAELLGWSDRVGAIAPGHYADLIAVNGNPLEDPTELERVTFVMKGGVQYLRR